MILREWRARTDAARAGAYPEHFRTDVAPALKQIDGLLGAQLCTRREDGGVTFVVLTRWRSLDAVRAFAGADYEKAVVQADAAAVLTGFDAQVRHYEVIEEVSVA